MISCPRVRVRPAEKLVALRQGSILYHPLPLRRHYESVFWGGGVAKCERKGKKEKKNLKLMGADGENNYLSGGGEEYRFQIKI